MARQIPLTQGKFALVDDEDFERINRFKWCVRSFRGRPHYAARGINRGDGRTETVLMHRVICDAPEVDHVNGDGLDNRRCNLRPATRSQNQANARPRVVYAGKPATSTFKGVSFDKGTRKWRACIRVERRLRYLGVHESERAAALAYNAAALEHYGEFARLNEVPHGDPHPA
jgi:hypothetical protein